jgi:clan AA aspartic protease
LSLTQVSSKIELTQEQILCLDLFHQILNPMLPLALPCTDPLYPTLVLLLSGEVENKVTQIPVLIDTGFDSFLIISRAIAKELNLKIIGETDVEIANGKNETYQIVEGTVIFLEFGNKVIDIEILVGDDEECLLGGKLLRLICKSFTIDYQKAQLQFKL